MAFIKEKESERELIPALDEPELIQLDETRLSRYGQSIVSVLGVIGAGVLAFVGLNNDTLEDQDPGLVVFGASVLLAVSLIAWAIVAAADIRARGDAAAANLALRARPNVTVAPAGLSGESAGLWCHLAGRESSDLHLVVDSRVDGKTSRYLLARNDETPQWYTQEQIDRWEVRSA